ncbi:hypothetical protein HanIR_Chr02g0082941 [Helianthus annuus]|nr:hypothetical protein HanIR_Chr02g0082941 [Helianthus annuus]
MVSRTRTPQMEVFHHCNAPSFPTTTAFVSRSTITLKPRTTAVIPSTIHCVLATTTFIIALFCFAFHQHHRHYHVLIPWPNVASIHCKWKFMVSPFITVCWPHELIFKDEDINDNISQSFSTGMGTRAMHRTTSHPFPKQRRERRPPWQLPLWRPIETKPNASGRCEWRPPWTEHSVLEYKDIFLGREY